MRRGSRPLARSWGKATPSFQGHRPQQLKYPAHQDGSHPESSPPNSWGSAKVTMAQRGQGTYPRSHSELVGELGLESRTAESLPRAPSVPPETSHDRPRHCETSFSLDQVDLAWDLNPGCLKLWQPGHLLARMLGIAREVVGSQFVWNQTALHNYEACRKLGRPLFPTPALRPEGWWGHSAHRAKVPDQEEKPRA